MGRQPSPELFRFLATHWPFSTDSLGQVRSGLTGLGSDAFHTFDRRAIEADLDEAIRIHGDARVRDIAQPIVLCLFGHGGDGKSTLAHLLKSQGIPVFSTDEFVCRLRGDWHSNTELRRLATYHCPKSIDNFIREVEGSSALQQAFVDLFFDRNYGFNLQSPLSIIEGFIHAPDVKPHNNCPQAAIVDALKSRGYRIWDAEVSK